MIDRATQKWKPILDQLNIDDEYRKDIALYCERKSTSEKDFVEQHLPVALKILSEIDLSQVMFTDCSEICQERSVSVSITKEQISELKFVTGIDMISMIERRLMDCIVTDLTKMINEEGGVIIYDLCVNRFSDIGSMSPKIVMSSLYLSSNVYRYKKLKKIKNKINER